MFHHFCTNFFSFKASQSVRLYNTIVTKINKSFIHISPCSSLPLPALFFHIRSTSSKDKPLVSGTKKRTKARAKTDITAKSKNVREVPKAVVSERNVRETIKFDIQFAVAAIPPHIPRYFNGYISELTAHGTGPMPGEKHII